MKKQAEINNQSLIVKMLMENGMKDEGRALMMKMYESAKLSIATTPTVNSSVFEDNSSSVVVPRQLMIVNSPSPAAAASVAAAAAAVPAAVAISSRSKHNTHV